jgi:hypothetical protein
LAKRKVGEFLKWQDFSENISLTNFREFTFPPKMRKLWNFLFGLRSTLYLDVNSTTTLFLNGNINCFFSEPNQSFSLLDNLSIGSHFELRGLSHKLILGFRSSSYFPWSSFNFFELFQWWCFV